MTPKEKKHWSDVPTYISASDSATPRSSAGHHGNAGLSTGHHGNAGMSSAGRKSAQHMKRIDNLSELFHRHIIQIIRRGEMCSRLAEFDVQISRVRLVPDFSGLNVWWVTSGTETDLETERLLFQHASTLRQILMTDNLGRVPRITFVRDDYLSRVAEIESLLETADMGDDEETDEYTKTEEYATNQSADESSDIAIKHNVYGLDHKALMAKLAAGPGKASDLGGIDFDPSQGGFSGGLRTAASGRGSSRKVPAAWRQKELIHGDAREHFRQQRDEDLVKDFEKLVDRDDV